MLEERHVQALRGSGHPAAAERLARRLADWVTAQPADLSPIARLVAIDAAASTLYDRYRRPFGNVAFPIVRVRRLQAELSVLAPSVGSDLRIRTRRIARDLETMSGVARTPVLDESAVESHQQSSSVIRSLNYAQGSLQTGKKYSEEDRRRFRQLHCIWTAMGQLAEDARLMTSPLAIETLGFCEVFVSIVTASRKAKWPLSAFLRVLATSIVSYVRSSRR